MSDGKIDVLVAEDSATTRMFLVHLLESDPRLRVAGAVGDGQAAIDFVRGSKPDVVLMDLHMPVLDGFEATRRIMETRPLPIVICSAVADPKEVDIAFRALEAGAVACIAKPTGPAQGDHEGTAAHLLQTVRLMSEVKVVRRKARPAPALVPIRFAEMQRATAQVEMVGIGTSTGGPPVLQTILAALPQDFPVPVLVVQHMARGFVAGMVEWLRQSAAVQVHIGIDGMRPLPGHVYVAPDDFHMGIGARGHIVLSQQEPENGLRPAVSFLFRSLAAAYGSKALGVLLTGMGKDGASELKLMRDKGAITIAQDRDSSIVHGMPGAAIALDAATHVLPADRIAQALVALVNQKNRPVENQ